MSLQHSGPREQMSQIRVEQSPHINGLIIRVYQEESGEHVSFPLHMPISELRKQKQLEQLDLVEDLWLNDWLEKRDQLFLLPNEKIMELPQEVREALRIPEPSSLKLKLGHESAVGLSSFRFVLDQEGTESSFQGPWIIQDDQIVGLMNPEQFRLQQAIENAPANMRDTERIFPYVAEVRSIAKQLGVPMDKYLQQQDYLFVNNLDIGLFYDGEQIKLEPQYTSNDDIPTDVLNDMGSTQQRYRSIKNGPKVFVAPHVQVKAKQVSEIPTIKGGDIPRFAQNPEAYIPEIEGVDLSLFGERVKSLGIRVYKAQPKVHAKERERGWFDLDMGFEVKDEITGETPSNFNSEEMKQIIEEARSSGEEYVQRNGQWIKVPKDAADFLEATEKARAEGLGVKSISAADLPLVLNIFENIDRLEFNQPILDAQQAMGDLGVLETMPPMIFKAHLKPFQTNGFVWMKKLHFRRLGGLLADDMGLGKTVQVISFLAYLQERELLGPTLIVVPKTLMANWQNEIRAFAPSLAPYVYLHSGASRVRDPEEIKHFKITVTTYQTLSRDQLDFGQVDWMAIICDEAQAIKNPSTAVSHAVKAMKTKFRLALTGTPVENTLSELWSIMDFVYPGHLGSLNEFREQFMKKLENVQEVDPDAENQLTQRLAHFYMRRTKLDELKGQIPDKSSELIKVPFGSVQKELYQDILRAVRNKEMGGLKAIHHLKQICSHPGLFDARYRNLSVSAVPKMQETIKILNTVRAAGEKALIFTEYREMQDILRIALRDQFDINPRIINGMTERRQDLVDEFNQRPGFDVMILSPKAAGTGLTITSANHVIHYTRWWNPAVENQATDRVYRIGQQRKVKVYHPVVTDTEGILSNGTVEQIVARLLHDKEDLARSVIIPSRRIHIEDEVLRSFA
ncbi:DEAD/DEAH box helicase [Paenibacillus sp. TRM 82003]|nr:DEAD/DEAH box helicase [Paenibacillus sp. TRM 82003]